MSGTATRRKGKPYIHATWLAKLLGGYQCLWSAWFRAHHRYEKFEEQALDLIKWNRDHNRLVAARVRELEREGCTVTLEGQNDFKLEGASAVIGGKPDIVATKDNVVLVVDGKTGRERESDIHQVVLYLYALPKVRPELATRDLEGEVQYARGDKRITVTPPDPGSAWLRDLVGLIQTIASDRPPRRVPSRAECERCNIGPRDCPQRVGAAREAVSVADF